MFEFKHLEAFVWVATLASFRRAAARLGTTQPAVSQRIALLEQALGTKLLERRPRSVAPTAKGRELLALAERMLRLRAEMAEAASEPASLRGTVRLGVAETIVHTWLARLIERAHAVYPEVSFDIEVDISPNLRAGLVAHDLDIAFLLGPVSEPRVISVPLSRYPLGWVASPRLALPAEPVRLAELAHWPLMTYPRQTRPYLALREMLARAGVAKARVFGNSSLSTIVRMTLDGIGVSVIPPVVIAREIEAGQLRLVRVDAALPDLVFTASYPLTPDNRLAIAIARLAAEVAQEADRRAPQPKRRAARKPQRRRPPSRRKR